MKFIQKTTTRTFIHLIINLKKNTIIIISLVELNVAFFGVFSFSSVYRNSVQIYLIE